MFWIKEICLLSIVGAVNLSFYTVLFIIDFNLGKDECEFFILGRFFAVFSKIKSVWKHVLCESVIAFLLPFGLWFFYFISALLKKLKITMLYCLNFRWIFVIRAKNNVSAACRGESPLCCGCFYLILFWGSAGDVLIKPVSR